MINIPIPELQKIVQETNSTHLLVKWADAAGKDLKNSGLTTAQIRALFGEVRQIESQWSINPDKAWRRTHLLKPKMAYRARKERGQAVKDLVSILDPALNTVLEQKEREKKEECFKRFTEFFEAILAYHRAYGGS
ncbi:MAG: type III-A CRISPR-associated protein Csm2 [Chloroflexi bacterium]|nr:type III-A CRISPR-associated protein Csm2 [Chloroflexota bacterium]